MGNAPETYRFADDGTIPNSTLPMLVYRGAVPPDPAAIELLFSQQDKWAFVDKPLEPLIAAMRPAGLTHDQAMACLKDQSKADAMLAIEKRATDEIKMTGTPTFVIDGKVYGGELSIDQLKAILDPLIKK